MIRWIACGSLCFVLASAVAFAADESEAVTTVLEAVKRNKLEAAEVAFGAALKEFPDSVRVNALHRQLFEMNAESERWPEAIGHLTAYIEHQFGKVGDLPTAANEIPGLVALLYRVQERDENSKPTIEVFDHYLKRLAEKSEAKPGQELTVAIAELTANKISWLMEHVQPEPARKLLENELADATRMFEKDPQEVASILRLNVVLRTQSQFAGELAPHKEQAHREHYLAFLSEQVQAHPEEVAVVGAYLNGHLREIQGLVLTDPDAAEKLLSAVKTFTAELKNPKPAVKRRLKLAEKSLAEIAPDLESARAHLALVGQRGAIPETDAWLNGGPLSAGDLEGKVVLLDFWAVWCGPCIATFPHLREWHEKFADKGLVIVGVTHYYSYDWDDEANKIKRDKDLSHQQECAATERFLAFHKLKHRIAVVDKEAKFDENYLVNGIPQAVLIDRHGKVRLIRVGSGPKNAQDLERMIEQLIAEPAQAGG